MYYGNINFIVKIDLTSVYLALNLMHLPVVVHTLYELHLFFLKKKHVSML